MKQVLQDLSSGEVRLLDVPVPAAAPGKILVRVHASAVSAGTERMLVEFSQKSMMGKALARPDLVERALEKFRRDGLIPLLQSVSAGLKKPFPLGYSCAGEVIGLGAGVEGFRVGDRVACAGAGFAVHAEFVCVPQNLCAILPPDFRLPYEEAAFATIGAIALHGLRLGETRLGESVAVIGLGLVGQFAVQLAKAAGCQVFGVELDPVRLELARSLGADLAVGRDEAEKAAQEFSGGRGVDCILIMADTPSDDPVNLAGSIAKDRGTVVAVGAVGMSIPRNLYYRKELSLRISRAYGPGRYDPQYEDEGRDYPFGYVRWTEGRNIEEVVRLMTAGQVRVKPLITHRIPIEDAPKAYSIITGKGKERQLGVVLAYGPEAAVSSKIKVREEVKTPGAKVTLGVLGSGAFANSVMLPLFRRSGAELEGIASASGASARMAADRYGFRFAAADESEIFRAPRVNAVVILTPHNQHGAQVRSALRAGKHVFVEKPLCLTREELESIQADKRKSPGLMVEVGFNRRFAPFTRELKNFFPDLERKVITIRINAGRLDPRHWTLDSARGGGRLVGEGCHFIDWANFLAGEAPERADCRAAGAMEGEQDWLLRLEYPGGSVAEILYLSGGAPRMGKERYEVHSEGKSAILEDFHTLQLFSAKRKDSRRSWLRSQKGHAEHWLAFVSALEQGAPQPTLWADIVATMETTFAAQESLRTGSPKRIPS